MASWSHWLFSEGGVRPGHFLKVRKKATQRRPGDTFLTPPAVYILLGKGKEVAEDGLQASASVILQHEVIITSHGNHGSRINTGDTIEEVSTYLYYS